MTTEGAGKENDRKCNDRFVIFGLHDISTYPRKSLTKTTLRKMTFSRDNGHETVLLTKFVGYSMDFE